MWCVTGWPVSVEANKIFLELYWLPVGWASFSCSPERGVRVRLVSLLARFWCRCCRRVEGSVANRRCDIYFTLRIGDNNGISRVCPNISICFCSQSVDAHFSFPFFFSSHKIGVQPLWGWWRRWWQRGLLPLGLSSQPCLPCAPAAQPACSISWQSCMG